MLFPQLGPEYLDERHKGILARMEAFYAESVTINQSFWAEADTDTRFMLNDQTLWNDLYGNIPTNRRRQFNFNHIRRIVHMVSGYQRRNRKSTIVTPIENGDAETADQFTKILMWIAQQEGVYETISEAFEGALVTGMNFLEVWVDYRTDPISGNIRLDNSSYNSFLVDPFFRKPDLSDCNSIWKRSFITKREVISLMPDYEEEIIGLQGNAYGTGRDGKFQYMPESYNYSMKNLLTYDQFWYRDYRTQRMLADAQTGETMEWRGKDEDALKLFLQTYPQVTLIEQEIPTTRLAIVVQGKVLYDGPNPLGIDQYPFVPVFAYYNPQTPYYPYRIQGMVRGLRDAQYLYNRRMITEADILESQVNSGYIYKENALVNPKDIFLSGQGKGIALKEEAQMTDVQKIPAPDIPQGMAALRETLGREILDISGVNEELLGSAIDDKAGVLSMLRQGAGLTTLQNLFDQLDYAQKLVGKIMLDIIQVNFTPGKVQKILTNEQPTAQFYSKAFGKYGCVVEEGFNTSTQKQMQFAQLLQLRDVGLQIPDDVLLEASTLQNKKKLVDAVSANAQRAQQVQHMQMQSAIQEQQARTNLANARATADEGLGIERLSRVQENQALAQERKAEAVKDDTQAILNVIKTMKEIEGIDIAQLEKIVALQRLLKNENSNPQVQQNGSVVSS